jgi:tetratricopeptide (TPR) repeat protein
MTHLKNNQFFGQPIIEIYFTIYQTLIEQQNPDHFIRLKALLRTYQHTIARQELADIYLLAINYCLRQMRQQKTNFMREALNLYEAGIESKTLYKDGYLSPWTFTNVIKLFLGVREYNKAEAFIKQYGSAMPPDFSENAVRYNLAELYYYTQRYDEAQVQLNQVEYTDPNFYLGARELLAKIYYETGAEESLLSMIASFTMFLKRNKKLSNNLKQPYLNFCRVLLKIVRRSKRDQATLEQELSETPLLASRHWLQKIAKEARS